MVLKWQQLKLIKEKENIDMPDDSNKTSFSVKNKTKKQNDRAEE